MIQVFSRRYYQRSYDFRFGLTSLVDVLSCLVTEERNGVYEAELEYPIDGSDSDFLEVQYVLLIKPNPYDNPQPFRIQSVKQQINGILTVWATHISYDLSGHIVRYFDSGVTSVADAMTQLSSYDEYIDNSTYFTFSTDFIKNYKMTVNTPTSIRSLLMGEDNSVTSIYGGELKFDYFDVKLLKDRGSDRGVVIEYGKNMTDMTYEIDCSELYTHILPYWYSEEDDPRFLSTYRAQNDDSATIALASADTYMGIKILPVDFSSDFTSRPSITALRQAANQYIEDNNLNGDPKITLDVSFIPTDKRIELCDTVTVRFSKTGLEVKAKCVKTVYNALTDRYESIELDNSPSLLSDTVARIK